MKILLTTCTRRSFDDAWNTRLYKSTNIYNDFNCASMNYTQDDQTLLKGKLFDLLINHSHTKPLTQTYNKCIKYAHENQYDTIILVHDDLSIEDSMLVSKVSSALKEYSVVGLAGSAAAEIKLPALWHLMGEQTDWRGAVCHRGENNGKEAFGWTNYGPSPNRVLILDGLFLACRVQDLIESNVKFDENIPHGGYHHYDILFSLAANHAGLKLGVWPIWAVHDSPGLLSQTPQYRESEQYFLKAASALV
ncbi:hypothetical protein CL634_11100 [bacterium]|nr:hypothetical protein [bacterium]